MGADETIVVPLDYGGPVDRPFEVFSDTDLESSIVDRFDAVARRFMSQQAIQDATVSLTYAEVAALVERIAAATIEATGDRAGPVALLLPANAQFPAAMFGVLAAGRAFIPLDANFPIERNRLIASMSGACAVLSSGDLVPDARTLFSDDVPVVDLLALPEVTPLRGDRLLSRRHSRSPGPDDLACIFFTSGSTGQPKGVALDHRSLLQRTQQNTNATHISSLDRILLLSSPSVAMGANCILYTLLNGASLHMLQPEDSASFARLIRERGITYYSSVPTLLRRLTESLDPSERLDSVRIVYLAGERIEWRDLEVCRRSFARDVFLFASLGSTECGTFVHWFADNTLTSFNDTSACGSPDDSLQSDDRC